METSRMNTAVDRRGMHSVQFEGQAEMFDELHQQYISNIYNSEFQSMFLRKQIFFFQIIRIHVVRM